MICYPIGTSGETITFSDLALTHMMLYRQTRFWQREAGGLLFARIEGRSIIIEEATGPRRSDHRTRTSFRGSRWAEQQEIDARHKLGLHYVGDWHTHPEARPSPSAQDHVTMTSRVRESRHSLNGFLFAIVGLAYMPEGLTLLVHDGTDAHQLEPDVPTDG